MDFFQYLIAVGIVTSILSTAWPLIGSLIGIPFIITNNSAAGFYFTKALGYYLLSSLIALLSLGYGMYEKGSPAAVGYWIAGGIAVFFSVSGGMAQGRREAAASHMYEALHRMRFDGYFLAGAILFYVLDILSPSFAINPLTYSAIQGITWLSGLPVIGFILGLVGFYFMINYLLQLHLYASLLSAALRPDPPTSDTRTQTS